eukprot:TRINITY_DN9078_c0_g1_i1.p1 TRINITY_DN9078_c0_g1~~TRINITY_DN9078_c0_g1_i1.p1  ORF type:complete len:289 (-),score=72.64 TRINITY_DN9078_c0_g1_i1:154-1020(-)
MLELDSHLLCLPELRIFFRRSLSRNILLRAEIIQQSTDVVIFVPENCTRKKKIEFPYSYPISKSERNLDFFEKEISPIFRLFHPNLARTCGYFRPPSPASHVLVYQDIYDTDMRRFVMRKIFNRDAFHDGWYSQVEIVNILRMVADGLQFIHSKGFIHRNIKLENVMVTLRSIGEIGIVHISDFAVSSIVDKDFEDPRIFYHTAPEVIQDRSSETSAADVWSFGMMVLELLGVELPKTVEQKTKEVADYPQLEGIPDFKELRTICRLCLRELPEERCSIEKVHIPPHH